MLELYESEVSDLRRGNHGITLGCLPILLVFVVKFEGPFHCCIHIGYCETVQLKTVPKDLFYMATQLECARERYFV
jgi:hypothetical protein